MTLDRYSHWISSMGRHAAEGMDEAWGQPAAHSKRAQMSIILPVGDVSVGR